jgi:hypothetical protein
MCNNDERQLVDASKRDRQSGIRSRLGAVVGLMRCRDTWMGSRRGGLVRADR